MRQLRRGTSRQELNVSWLKKNELDIKRHVTELRETIKNNWSTTGRELRDEFRNYWAPSPRPSPPYQFGTSGGGSRDTLSPQHERNNPALMHLEPPSRPQSPHTEFANGYSLGLIGGVRSWVGELFEPSICMPLTWNFWAFRCDQEQLPVGRWQYQKPPLTTKIQKARMRGNRIARRILFRMN